MTDADKKAFAAMMVALAEYYRVEMTKDTMRFYFEGLIDHDIADVQAAAQKHMKDSEHGAFLPKVADFMRYLGDSNKARASDAWVKVSMAIRRIGPYQSVCFDDPLIHGIVREMGGWGRLCDTQSDKMGQVQATFEKRYERYANKGEMPADTPRYLMGETEAHNRSVGALKFIDPPVIVGDTKRAQAALAAPKPQKAIGATA